MELSGLRNIWVGLIVVFIALTIVTIYNTSKTSVLHLPVSKTTVVLSFLLSLTQAIQCGWLLYATKVRSSLAVNLAWILSILDGALITLASFQNDGRVLDCSLESTWRHWFQLKDAGSIRRIQNSFNCCGLRSPLDQAWPFPDSYNGADACQTTYHRTNSCYDDWHQATSNALFIFIVVGTVSLSLKVFLSIGLQLRRSPFRASTLMWRPSNQERRALLPAEEQEQEQNYTDDATTTPNIEN